ncbi:MAG: sugar nucleotide-binding protein [Bacteroidota bacterium]
MKRILVTGANGQLGSELRALSKEYPFEFVFVDVAELDLIGDVKPFFDKNIFSFIINCAAYTAVDKAEEDKDLCMKVNADAVGRSRFDSKITKCSFNPHLY